MASTPPAPFELATAATLYSVHPLVGCIDGFVDDDALDEIEAALAHRTLEPARVARLDGHAVDEKRVATQSKIPHDSLPPIDAVTEKVGALFRLKPSLCEYPEFIRYEQGGEYKLHFDSALGGTMTGQGSDPAIHSQRILTAILYLNDDFEGGATSFPRLDVNLTPKRGTLAFWQNTKHGSAKVHHLSMHQGCPVTKGVKRIVSFWFRDRPWTAQSDL
ncbi:MAG: 2OG-Fe(II) oxygenase [Pseudomonadota bacterium]